MSAVSPPRRALLDGVNIVDLSSGLAGPFATRLLAELGAEVVKVEPSGGDPARVTAPAGFASWNRSKQSVTLRLDDAVDREHLESLLGAADVLVHDFTPAKAKSYGLDDEALRQRHPQLIVSSVTAYPVGHPDAERFGTELLVQARSGAMDEQEGLRPGPIAIRMPFASWGAAYLLAGGIGVQLFVRERHDVAEPIHTSLLQGSLVPAALYWQRAELPPEWMRAHTLPKRDAPPHLSIFRCADGRWLQVIGAFTKSPPMVAFLKEIGRVDLAGVRCLPGNQFEWAAVFAHRTLDEWTRELWAVDVPCMPVLDLGEVLATDQARLNGYAVEVNDPVFGATLQAGHPIETDPAPVVRHGAPEIGTVSSLPSTWRHPRTTAVTSEAATGTADPTRPLSGVRVVDFGAYVAGPLGAQCLADFGAEVIKVEPIGGEKGRTLNQFTACQRGKRSLAIDLRHPLVAPVRERLLQWADIVTHNMRSSAAAKLGVDESAIRAANPRAIIALSSGYGERGKWAPLPAFDPTGLALSGWEQQISGPDRRPTFLRNSSMDCQTGLALFVGSGLALFARERGGDAAVVRSSLLAVAATTSSETLLIGGTTAAPFDPIDAAQTGVSPFCRIYPTSAGWVAVDAVSAEQRERLLEAMGVAVPGELAEAFSKCTAAEAVLVMEAAGVPTELVRENYRDDFFDAELLDAQGLVRRIDATPYGWFEGPSGYWSGRAGHMRNGRNIPGIGEHSASVLRDLGFTDGEIRDLVEAGAVQDGSAA